MEKLAEDIWKAVLCSLVAMIAIVGFMRFIDQEKWWRIEEDYKPEEYENNPFVYYQVANSEEKQQASAQLFVRNIFQEEFFGNSGLFNNILPGQILSVRIKFGEQSVLSPVFRLKDREVRLLKFKYDNDKLTYLGSYSRYKKNAGNKIMVLDQRNVENLFQMDILKGIENYKPFEEAVAKEEDKEIAKALEIEGSNTEKNLLKNPEIQFSPLLYLQFFPEHRPICE